MSPRAARVDSDAENFAPDDPEFFRKAPAKIGDLLSLHTSMSEFDEPPTMLYRFVKATIIAVVIEVILVIGAAIVFYFRHANANPLILVGLFLGLSLLSLAITYGVCLFSAGFTHFCAYVGKEGCAYYACSRSRDNLTASKVLLYEDARDLRIATTHHYYNGAYQQTTFSYTWTDDNDNVVFSIDDAHAAEHDFPPRTHVYFFALEAEEAWSNYVLEQVLRKLKKGGSHKFRLSGSNYLLLRGDSLKLSLHGNTQEFEEDDLSEIEIANGQISIKEPGAKKGWFTDTGIHVFTFAELSNARVFLLLLNKLFDVPIT